jgi:hypothetical protein
MSERDPNAENAVNPNFNDDISDSGLTVVNISATTLIYSQCSEKIVCICTRLNSHVHLIVLLTLQLQTEPEQNQ